MGTKRVPLNRPPARKITARAVALFEALKAERDGSSQWWAIHGELHAELQLPPWSWPIPPEFFFELDRQVGAPS